MKITDYALVMFATVWATSSVQAQDPYYGPATGYDSFSGVESPYPYVPGYLGGGTVQGSILQGQAALARGIGEANYLNSKALINIETARDKSLDNERKIAEVFWDKRRMWQDQMAVERGSPLSTEQLRQLARESSPSRLTPFQLQPATGRIEWPMALRGPQFDRFRQDLDTLFANRTVSNTGVGSETEVAALTLTKVMLDQLRLQIDEMPVTQYVAAKNFVRSLAYEARFLPGVEGVASR